MQRGSFFHAQPARMSGIVGGAAIATMRLEMTSLYGSTNLPIFSAADSMLASASSAPFLMSVTMFFRPVRA